MGSGSGKNKKNFQIVSMDENNNQEKMRNDLIENVNKLQGLSLKLTKIENENSRKKLLIDVKDGDKILTSYKMSDELLGPGFNENDICNDKSNDQFPMAIMIGSSIANDLMMNNDEF